MSEFVKLTEYCDVNMGQSPASSSYNAEQRGIPFFQGNADFGNQNPHVRLWCNAPTKIAHCGDLLLSVRAPIGALNIANCTCCIGRGLAALTAKQKVCDPSWLYFALKSKISELQAQGTGSTFKAINKAALQNLLLPSCSLSEQQHIASVLRKVCCLITARQQQLTMLDQLAKSRFIEMFGDPVTNPREWETLSLDKLGELNRGVSKARPRNSPDLLGGIYPLVQTGEVSNSDTYITNFEQTYSEKGLAQSKMWQAGTLCITIAANIAQTAILTFDACFPDSVVGFVANDKTKQLFIHYWFKFFQKILDEQAPQVAQKNINLKILRELQVIVPPKPLQDEFCRFIEQLDKSKVTIRKSIEKLETTYRALLQEYFG